MKKLQNDKKILWYQLAFMAFSGVWGFGNVINGFSEYGGIKAIVSWVILFAIYFVPYALMVGELGSAFKNENGGVSAWIRHTINPSVAYMAGWTYWIVHMPYISQKPNASVIAASWAFFRDARASQMNIQWMTLICLVLFFFAVWIASKGVGVLKKLTSLAGSAMFILSLLFILMMITAPKITGANIVAIDWSADAFLPTLNKDFFLSLSILVFAVGGCEKISPYVNKTKHPERDFSKGMLTLAIMVAVCAVFGTIALGMMFDSDHIPQDLMTNGAYYAFQTLGEFYHVGDLFVIVYAIVNLIGQFSVMVLSIDAPLRMLLDSADETYIPKILFQQNKHGTYTNGHKLILVIVSVLIIVPVFGIKNVDALVKWLVKVNSVCMPLRYLWVFTAYIALKKAGKKFTSEYHFVKNRILGIFFGTWCFFITAFACILGIYSEDPFQLMLNITTPFLLIGLGFIMPIVARKHKN